MTDGARPRFRGPSGIVICTGWSTTTRARASKRASVCIDRSCTCGVRARVQAYDACYLTLVTLTTPRRASYHSGEMQTAAVGAISAVFDVPIHRFACRIIRAHIMHISRRRSLARNFTSDQPGKTTARMANALNPPRWNLIDELVGARRRVLARESVKVNVVNRIYTDFMQFHTLAKSF